MEKEEKKGYGEFGNVKLTDEDIQILSERFPTQYKEYIEKVDGYCESRGKRYKNYRATIQNWIKRDAERVKPKNQAGSISRTPTYDLERIKRDAQRNTAIKY